MSYLLVERSKKLINSTKMLIYLETVHEKANDTEVTNKK